ncbi:MAG TPA: OsmC family protein [Fimbriimonadaceae bacterium]|nr:OsmC family protein [Fimbriimonadaceae bacterium]
MSSVHEYPVTVDWIGGRGGSGVAQAGRSGVTFPLSVPPEFQGPGEGTNPEEILTTAIAACYSITFGIIAGNRKLPFTNIETKATGMVEQAGAQFTYTRVVLRPKITLESGATDDHVKMAEDMAHKADLYCIITNSVRDKVKIDIEPEIVRT